MDILDLLVPSLLASDNKFRKNRRKTMKKTIAFILAALLLTGCAEMKPSTAETTAPTTAETVQETAVPEETTEAATEAAAGKVVMPLPSTLDLDNIQDCTVAVGFAEKTDAYMEDSQFVIRMDVYERELFDLVDMSTLAVGDVMVIAGQNVPVESITEENGAKLINGGYEAGGYTFYTKEDGVFYSVKENDKLDYQLLGEIIVPVAQDFTLVDQSNLEEKTINADALLAEASESDAVFQPDNTVAQIVNGELQNITVSYRP